MLSFISKPKQNLFSKLTLILVLFSFLGTSLGVNYAHAALTLPEPTQLLGLSATYSFPILKGLKLNPANPLQIEFIIDSANQDTVDKEEASKLIRYFLAGLTIPEDDLWVNLSVYEKDRMINESAAQTDVGRDMLAQDYVLKQLVSSLTYPESEVGKSYWQKAYQAAAKAFGTTDIKLDTFNKIWIAPDKAEVYEYKNTAVVNQATLKAMLEQDFLALQKGTKDEVRGTKDEKAGQINKVASDVMREVVVPKITEDINSGKNFATLRQIYYSLILAKWFKEKFKESFYKHYINQKKIKGIDTNDPQAKEKIYNLYTQAFKKGIYDYIKKESDPATHKQVRRRYFSGGVISNFEPGRFVVSGLADSLPLNAVQGTNFISAGAELATGAANDNAFALAASPMGQKRPGLRGWNTMYDRVMDNGGPGLRGLNTAYDNNRRYYDGNGNRTSRPGTTPSSRPSSSDSSRRGGRSGSPVSYAKMSEVIKSIADQVTGKGKSENVKYEVDTAKGTAVISWANDHGDEVASLTIEKEDSGKGCTMTVRQKHWVGSRGYFLGGTDNIYRTAKYVFDYMGTIWPGAIIVNDWGVNFIVDPMLHTQIEKDEEVKYLAYGYVGDVGKPDPNHALLFVPAGSQKARDLIANARQSAGNKKKGFVEYDLRPKMAASPTAPVTNRRIAPGFEERIDTFAITMGLFNTGTKYRPINLDGAKNAFRQYAEYAAGDSTTTGVARWEDRHDTYIWELSFEVDDSNPTGILVTAMYHDKSGKTAAKPELATRFWVLDVFANPNPVSPIKLATFSVVYPKARSFVSQEEALRTMLKSAGKDVIRITLSNDNGLPLEIAVPDFRAQKPDLMEQIYAKYVAMLYAQAEALRTGPSQHLYVEARNRKGNRDAGTESKIVSAIEKYFTITGDRLFDKINSGNPVEILKKPDDLVLKSPTTLEEWVAKQYAGKTITRRENPVVIALDIGGQGMKPYISRNGKDVTAEVLKDSGKDSTRDEDVAADKTLAYRLSYPAGNDRSAGKVFGDRVVAYVMELRAAAEKMYGPDSVVSVAIDSAGTPDYAKGRMTSLGSLSAGFVVDKAQEISDAGMFIPELIKLLPNAVVLFGNDMQLGWGNALMHYALASLSAADAEKFKTANILFDGGGIGTCLVIDGKVVIGLDECGHLIWDTKTEEAVVTGLNSPIGSYEESGGSERAIMHNAEALGLADMLKKAGFKREVTPKQIGLLATGTNPVTGNPLSDSSDDKRMKELAIKVWDRIARIDAEHIIFMYKLTKVPNVIFGGGTTSGDTGTLRVRLMNKYLKQYRERLGIEEKIEIILSRGKTTAAMGAALKGQEMYEELLAAASPVSAEKVKEIAGILKTRGEVFDSDVETALDKLGKAYRNTFGHNGNKKADISEVSVPIWRLPGITLRRSPRSADVRIVFQEWGSKPSTIGTVVQVFPAAEKKEGKERVQPVTIVRWPGNTLSASSEKINLNARAGSDEESAAARGETKEVSPGILAGTTELVLVDANEKVLGRLRFESIGNGKNEPVVFGLEHWSDSDATKPVGLSEDSETAKKHIVRGSWELFNLQDIGLGKITLSYDSETGEFWIDAKRRSNEYRPVISVREVEKSSSPASSPAKVGMGITNREELSSELMLALPGSWVQGRGHVTEDIYALFPEDKQKIIDRWMDSLEAFARAHAQNADHAQEMIQRGIALIGLNARKEIVEFRSGSGYHVYADTIVGWARNRNRFFDALSHMEKIIGSAAADQRSADRSSLATIQKHIDVLEGKGKANSREDIDAGIKTLADLEGATPQVLRIAYRALFNYGQKILNVRNEFAGAIIAEGSADDRYYSVILMLDRQLGKVQEAFFSVKEKLSSSATISSSPLSAKQLNECITALGYLGNPDARRLARNLLALRDPNNTQGINQGDIGWATKSLTSYRSSLISTLPSTLITQRSYDDELTQNKIVVISNALTNLGRLGNELTARAAANPAAAKERETTAASPARELKARQKLLDDIRAAAREVRGLNSKAATVQHQDPQAVMTFGEVLSGKEAALRRKLSAAGVADSSFIDSKKEADTVAVATAMAGDVTDLRILIDSLTTEAQVRENLNLLEATFSALIPETDVADILLVNERDIETLRTELLRLLTVVEANYGRNGQGEAARITSQPERVVGIEAKDSASASPLDPRQIGKCIDATRSLRNPWASRIIAGLEDMRATGDIGKFSLSDVQWAIKELGATGGPLSSMHTTPGSEAQLITLRREERDAAALNNFRILERELKRSGRGIAGSPLNNSEVARKVAQEVSKALYGSDLDPLHHYIPNGSDALQQIIMRHLQGETLEKEENRRLSDKDWQLDIKFLPTDDGSLVVGYDLKLKITSGWVSVVWGNTKGIALTQTGTAASPIENLPALDSQIKSATEGQGNIGAMKDVVSRLRQTRLFDVLGTQGREENYAAYLGRIGEAAQSRVRAHAYEISQQRHNDQGISPDEETAARADWIQAEHELLQPVSGYLKQAQTAFDSAAQDAAAYIAHAIINLVFRSTGGAEGNLDTTHRLTEEIARSFRDPAGVTFSLQQRAQERAGRRDPGMTVTFSYRDRETGREMNSLLHGFFLTSERLDKSGYTLGDMLTRVEHTRAARELAEFAETRPLINLPNLEARIEKAIEVFNAYQAEPSPAADGIAQIIGGLSLTILAARNKPLLELLRQFHYHYDDRIKGNRIVLTLSGHPTTIVGDRLIPALSEYLRAIPIEIKKTVAATAREFRQNYQGPEATDDEHWLAAEEYLFSRFGSLAGGASSAVEFGQYLEKLLSAGKTRVHFKDTKLGYLKVTGEEIVGDSWMRTVNSAQDLDLTVSLDLGRKMLILQRRPSSSGDVKSVMSGESSRTESPSGTSSASDEEITSQFTQVIRNYWEKHTQKGFPMKNGIEDKKVLWKVNFALRQKGFQPIGLSELDVLQNALAAGGIQMHKVDRSLFKVKRRYYVIYSVKPVSSSPSPATAGSPAVTADDLRDTADRILRNIGMRSMHVHITTVMADVTERLHGAEATRQNVMDAVAAINHRLGEFPGASLYEVSNDGVISLPSDNDPDGRRSLSEEWGRIKTLNYENMPVTAIMQRLTLTPEAVYTALKAISASRDYLSMFFVQNGRIVTEEKNHMTDSRQYPDFNRAEFTQVASSNLGLTTTPGGIKMSNIPVISSAASQKIEFAAIGPDFFDRLTFRIVSMKHIVSLAQFASLP